MSPEALIGVFVDLVADRIVERLRAEVVRAPRYATARENPLGSRRAFLDAHRAGAFPTFRRGREIAADWSAVEAWMREARATPEPTKNNAGPSIEQMLEASAAPRRRRGRTGG